MTSAHSPITGSSADDNLLAFSERTEFINAGAGNDTLTGASNNIADMGADTALHQNRR